MIAIGIDILAIVGAWVIIRRASLWFIDWLDGTL